MGLGQAEFDEHISKLICILSQDILSWTQDGYANAEKSLHGWRYGHDEGEVASTTQIFLAALATFAFQVCFILCAAQISDGRRLFG